MQKLYVENDVYNYKQGSREGKFPCWPNDFFIVSYTRFFSTLTRFSGDQ